MAEIESARELTWEENDDWGLSMRCLKDLMELVLMGRTEAEGNNCLPEDDRSYQDGCILVRCSRRNVGP